MKKCSECNGIMKELAAKTPEGIGYNYYQSHQCGEEILNMEQLSSLIMLPRNIGY